ncbi:hypothetical protein ACFQU2_06310 [Siccirubricoccus deserti]
MTIQRRHLLGAAAASGFALPGISRARARQINLAGASFDMREPILRDSPSAPASSRAPG